MTRRHRLRAAGCDFRGWRVGLLFPPVPRPWGKLSQPDLSPRPPPPLSPSCPPAGSPRVMPWGPPRLQAADLCPPSPLPLLLSLSLCLPVFGSLSLSISASVSLSGQSHFEEFGCRVPRGAGLNGGAEDGVWRRLWSRPHGGSPCLCAVPLVLAKGRSSGQTHLACSLPLGWRQLGRRWLMLNTVALYPACVSSGSGHILHALVHQGTLLASGDLRHPGTGWRQDYIISGHLCPSEAQREPTRPREIGR